MTLWTYELWNGKEELKENFMQVKVTIWIVNTCIWMNRLYMEGLWTDII